MQQLKKLSDTHYVVVTDEPINFNDYYLSCLSNRVLQRTEKMDIVEVNDKKIIYSTEPLEEIVIGITPKGYDKIKYLGLSYAKSLSKDIDDKKYTEEDILGAMEIGFELGKNFDYDNPNIGLGWLVHQKDSYVESLTQPKDTWECEFIDGQLKIKGCEDYTKTYGSKGSDDRTMEEIEKLPY